MAGPAELALFAVLAAGAPATAPAPSTLPRIIDTLPCVGPAEEVVVCGRRPAIEPYRIPPALREGPLVSRNYSWSARARDEREADRYSGPPVGAGSFARSRQAECEWRAERQEIAGLMIDCTQRRTTAE
jgi:hypothetical protein